MQLPDDVHLQRVDVLVLVHEHVLEAAGDRPARSAPRPSAPATPAAGRRGRAVPARACGPRRRRTPPTAARRAPRTRGTSSPGSPQRQLGVDHPRVDVEHRARPRDPPGAGRVPPLAAQQVQQVGGVAGVEHAEAAHQPERAGVQAHEAVGERMEGAAHDRARAGARRRRLGARPPHELAGRPAREGHQQQPLGACPWEISHAARAAERGRLAGPCSRQDQQRPPSWVAASSWRSFSDSSSLLVGSAWAVTLAVTAGRG